jgi:large subunit ribosomal protein L32
MPVPKKRTSKSVKGMRRSHDAIKATAATMLCPACGELKLMHRACPACGVYRNSAPAAAPAAEPSGEIEQVP